MKLRKRAQDAYLYIMGETSVDASYPDRATAIDRLGDELKIEFAYFYQSNYTAIGAIMDRYRLLQKVQERVGKVDKFKKIEEFYIDRAQRLTVSHRSQQLKIVKKKWHNLFKGATPLCLTCISCDDQAMINDVMLIKQILEAIESISICLSPLLFMNLVSNGELSKEEHSSIRKPLIFKSMERVLNKSEGTIRMPTNLEAYGPFWSNSDRFDQAMNLLDNIVLKAAGNEIFSLEDAETNIKAINALSVTRNVIPIQSEALSTYWTTFTVYQAVMKKTNTNKTNAKIIMMKTRNC
ncbi:hypothetical protein A1QO_02460 [Vibrio genomosp. F10 str. ZF-129]|uniref:Uncharacterized protein n=1 Tax=Vibrio genomosp. F10 str. ZF-129 TaxID=1187848 RepID=A0A1E5BK50_9VIBR|nr:hypothetical protein [Vibrio genomosp. F10]OEE38259.1 hypothetical protein A1QO_02460 [Vibrio genomosp. F10 str. ZF-129]